MGPSKGSWWTKSKSDARWDMSGRGTISMLGCPQMDEAVRAKERELGIAAPEDLEVGGMKD